MANSLDFLQAAIATRNVEPSPVILPTQDIETRRQIVAELEQALAEKIVEINGILDMHAPKHMLIHLPDRQPHAQIEGVWEANVYVIEKELYEQNKDAAWMILGAPGCPNNGIAYRTDGRTMSWCHTYEPGIPYRPLDCDHVRRIKDPPRTPTAPNLDLLLSRIMPKVLRVLPRDIARNYERLTVEAAQPEVAEEDLTPPGHA